MFRALRHPPFRVLWTVVILGQLGYWISSVAFQWEVAHRTGNDPLALGLLYFCGLAPYLFLSLPAGMLADSVDRRRVMIAVQAAAAVLAVTATLLATASVMSTLAVMLLSFLAGCVITVVSPASQALVATAVPAEDLASAVPLQSAGLNLARITGPALVGPVLLFGGSASAFGVYAVLSLGAATLAVRLHSGGPAGRATGAAETIRHRLAAAVRHVRERRPALPALGIVAATSVFGSSYLAQLPLLASRVDGGTESTFPALVTLSGIGSLVGVLSVAWRGRGLTLLSAAAQLVVLGVVVALFGVVPSFLPLTVLMILGGGLTLSIMTSINSILQHLIDDAQRGRVMSLYFICWGGLLPFGGLGLGGLVRLVGAGWAFAGFGATACLAGLALALRARRYRA